jgi:hypothetical protein
LFEEFLAARERIPEREVLSLAVRLVADDEPPSDRVIRRSQNFTVVDIGSDKSERVGVAGELLAPVKDKIPGLIKRDGAATGNVHATGSQYLRYPPGDCVCVDTLGPLSFETE